MEVSYMGKNHSKKKKHKPFHPIPNGNKLQKLKPKLRKLESDNSGRNPKSSSSPSGEKDKRIFSEKDRENVLHIRRIFSNAGKMPEYHEKSNAIKFSVKGDLSTHRLCISCYSDVLKIFTFIDTNNNSNELLNHLMELNFRMQMGSFCCNTERDYIMFNLGIPLNGKLEKDFIGSIIKYTANILDDCIPGIITCIREANHWKREDRNPTFH